MKKGQLMLLVALALFSTSVLLPGLSDASSTAMMNRLCSETDGGLDFYHAGVTTAYNGQVEDKCLDALHLQEGYCQQGLSRTIVKDCVFGCRRDACVLDNPNNIWSVNICNDSDGGKNYSVRGRINVDSDREDKCLTTHRLLEWHCKGNMATTNVYLCEFGCKDGRCESAQKQIKQVIKTSSPPMGWTVTAKRQTTTTTIPCNDSDGGIVYDKAGTLVASDAVRTDDCIGYKRLREWYCSRGKARSAIVMCERGCLNGACNKEILIS
jgi:hypothetical protein